MNEKHFDVLAISSRAQPLIPFVCGKWDYRKRARGMEILPEGGFALSRKKLLCSFQKPLRMLLNSLNPFF